MKACLYYALKKMNKDSHGFSNLLFLGNFVQQEIMNKPLPSSLDPVFSRLIDPTYSLSYHSGRTVVYKKSAEYKRKRKAEFIEEDHANANASSLNVSAKKDKGRKEVPIEVSFVSPTGYQSMLTFVDNLLVEWSTLLSVFARELLPWPSLIKIILVQLRDLILVSFIRDLPTSTIP